jgi:hypothetical protein
MLIMLLHYIILLPCLDQLWKTLATDPADISTHVFLLCNRNGYVIPDGVKDFMETLHGKNFEDIPALRKTVHDLTNTAEELPRCNAIYSAEFSKLCSEHPVLMAPMLRTNLAVRKDFLGDPFWRSLTLRMKADKVTADPFFIYVLTDDIVSQYIEKNAKIEYEKRVKNVGTERGAIKGVYGDHDAAERATKARAARTETAAAAGNGGDYNFNASKAAKDMLVQTEQKKKKNKRKEDFDQLLKDDVAMDVINGRNCPEKLDVLMNHQFRYNSQGTEPAMPGTWTPPPRQKPSSPRAAGSPRSSPRVGAGLPPAKVHAAEGERPRRGSDAGAGERAKRRGSDGGEGEAGDRPRSRGSDGGGRGRRPRAVSLDVAPDGGRPQSSGGNRPQSPMVTAEKDRDRDKAGAGLARASISPLAGDGPRRGSNPDPDKRPSSSGSPSGYRARRETANGGGGRPQSPIAIAHSRS